VKFYVDTSVWRDYFEDRRDNIRPLGEFAFRFLRECQEKKYTILVSNHIVKELLTDYSSERIKLLFSNFKNIIKWVAPTKKQRAEAYFVWTKTNRKYPQQGILHSIVARDYKAILISRDRHFNEIGIVELHFPEEFI